MIKQIRSGKTSTAATRNKFNFSRTSSVERSVGSLSIKKAHKDYVSRNFVIKWASAEPRNYKTQSKTKQKETSKSEKCRVIIKNQPLELTTLESNIINNPPINIKSNVNIVDDWAIKPKASRSEVFYNKVIFHRINYSRLETTLRNNLS